MKKNVFLIIAMILACMANARIAVKPELGLNLARANALVGFGSLGYDYDTKTKPGLRAGVTADIELGSGFFAEPGFFYTAKGAKLYYKIFNYESKGSFTLDYLEVPVNLGYRYSIRKAGSIFVTVGPYLGYAVSGSSKIETVLSGISAGTRKDDIGFGTGSGHIKRIDFGFNFSAGYQLPMGLYARVQYGLGTTNLAAESPIGGKWNLKNRVLTFSVGYAFGL